MTIRAIETKYRGYRFRSRLEARWAVFFDALRIKWTYEPEGYELPDGSRYLVDFYLPEYQVFAEVKPDDHSETSFTKAIELAKATGKPILKLSGDPKTIPFKIYLPEDDEHTDCILQNCGRGFPSEIYLNVGGFISTDSLEEMCDGIRSSVAAACGARFEFGESGAA
jgi:hypothetical protein